LPLQFHAVAQLAVSQYWISCLPLFATHCVGRGFWQHFMLITRLILSVCRRPIGLMAWQEAVLEGGGFQKGGWDGLDRLEPRQRHSIAVCAIGV